MVILISCLKVLDLTIKQVTNELREYLFADNDELNSQIKELAKMVWKEDVTYEFTNMRLDGVDDKIKKCECSAEMEFTISPDGMNDLGLDEGEVFKTRTVLIDAQNTDEELLVWFDFEKLNSTYKCNF